MKSWFYLLLLFPLLSLATSAPQSTAFTYQGVLNASGHPASGNFDLAFRLFDAATLGNQIGTAIGMPQFPVANGVFTVDLDFPGAFNGSQRWLEVTVGTETLIPRQPVNAVPVAGYALSGNPGPSGNPGKSSLIAQGYEPPGANCSSGGIKLMSGVDLNANGTLDANEVTATNYVCGTSPAGPPPGTTCTTNSPLTINSVSATAVPPINDGFARMGSNGSPIIILGDTVQLQASVSDSNTCTNNYPMTLTYVWSLITPLGSASKIQGDAHASYLVDVAGGTYTAQLTVTDAGGNSDTYQVPLTSRTCGASPPNFTITWLQAGDPPNYAAIFKANPSYRSQQTGYVYFSADQDPTYCPARFSAVTFAWSLDLSPFPASWQFSNASSQSTQFLPNTQGLYRLAMKVSGALGNNGSQYVLFFVPGFSLSAAPNPSVSGQSVTLTASVTSAPSGDGIDAPTGTITFIDSGTAISGCTNISLNNATATCITSSLISGQHIIEASYSGDLNYKGAISNNVTQSVN